MASLGMETRGIKRNRYLGWKIKASPRVDDQPRRYSVDIGKEFGGNGGPYWYDMVTTDLLTQALLPHDPKWGDLISICQAGTYRNQGLYIFDGKKVVDLCRCVDDYGALPPNFQMGMPHPVTGKPIPFNYWWRNNRPEDERQWLRSYNLWGNQPYHGKPEDRPDPPPSSVYPGCDLRDEWNFERVMDHNELVWFDHRPYRDELLHNLVTDGTLVRHLHLDSIEMRRNPIEATWCITPFDKVIIINESYKVSDMEYRKEGDLKEMLLRDELIPFEFEYDKRFQKPRMFGYLYPSNFICQMRRAEHVCKYDRCDVCKAYRRLS